MMVEYEMHQMTDGERLHVLSDDCWCQPVHIVVADDAPDDEPED